MSCQSWWCGGDATIELGRAPAGSRVALQCGCVVRPAGETSRLVTVVFETAHCPEHRSAPRLQYPAATPVQIDLLASLLEDAR